MNLFDKARGLLGLTAHAADPSASRDRGAAQRETRTAPSERARQAERNAEQRLKRARARIPGAQRTPMPRPDWPGGVTSTEDLEGWAEHLNWVAEQREAEAGPRDDLTGGSELPLPWLHVHEPQDELSPQRRGVMNQIDAKLQARHQRIRHTVVGREYLPDTVLAAASDEHADAVADAVADAAAIVLDQAEARDVLARADELINHLDNCQADSHRCAICAPEIDGSRVGFWQRQVPDAETRLEQAASAAMLAPPCPDTADEDQARGGAHNAASEPVGLPWLSVPERGRERAVSATAEATALSPAAVRWRASVGISTHGATAGPANRGHGGLDGADAAIDSARAAVNQLHTHRAQLSTERADGERTQHTNRAEELVSDEGRGWSAEGHGASR